MAVRVSIVHFHDSAKMDRLQVILALILIASLAACTPSNPNNNEGRTQDVTIIPILETSPATQTVAPAGASTQAILSTLSPGGLPDVVVHPRRIDQAIQLQAGQVLRVEMPSPDFEWQVDYDPVLFELLTAPEMVKNPGPEGWSFRAVSTGQGQIVLTSIVSCSEPPCPLIPMTFQLVVQVN